MTSYSSGLIPGPGNVYSGTALQGAINDLIGATHSGHMSATRPTLAAAGMLWVKDLGGNEADLMMFAGGSSDIALARVNTSSGEVSGTVPIGGVMMWSGSIATIPYGWSLCDGSGTTPDLTDRFVIGAGGALNPDATGGANSFSLSAGQVPAHTHTTGTLSVLVNSTSLSGTIDLGGNGLPSNLLGTGVFSTSGNTGTQAGFGSGSVVRKVDFNATHGHTATISGSTGSSGSGTAIDNRPAFYALAYIMRVF